MTKRPCQHCGAELPPHTRQALFKDKQGRQAYYPHDMAQWMTNLEGKVAPEQVIEWKQSARGSKAGLVMGYEYDTGTWGHEGKGEFCSMKCAAIGRKPATKKQGAMSPARMKAIRRKVKLSAVKFARVLGYGGTDRAAEVTVRRFESGGRPIPAAIAKVALLIEKNGVPREWRGQQ